MFINCFNAFSQAYLTFTKDIEYQELLNIITSHKRLVYVAIGKNVPICLVTMRLARSFGIGQTVIDANDFFHGDAGTLKKGDLLCYVSKSGNTDELIRVAEYINGQYPAIAITSNKDGKILKYCSNAFIIPIEDEGCKFNSPFVSTALFLLLMNAILAELVDRKCITKKTFAWNHSGGQIGEDLKKEKNA